jgi:hypothetical protein
MKEIRISFSITLLIDRCDVNYVEEELLKKREDVFKEIMVRVLERIERERLRQEIKCPACEGDAIKKGSEGRKIETLIGKILYTRARFKCKRCGGEFYPLDNAIGLEPQRKCTLGVIERALWAATEVSYAKSAEFLKKFTGLEVSHGYIHNEAVEEGKRISQWEQARRQEVFEKGMDVGESKQSPEILYIQVDGTAVNDRSSGQWMECKIGAAFSQRAMISKNRFLLLDKRSYASIESAEDFGEKFFMECIRQGVLEARRVYFISDGASWIRSVKEGYFPNSIGVLDIWHIERELKRSLGEKRKKAVELLKQQALAGNAQEMLRRLAWIKRRARSIEDKRKIEETIHYIETNQDWISNIPKVGGYGSGPVEKTVDITVARRLKRRGMSWYKNGANPLLKLRLLRLNGDWDSYWSKRKENCAMFLAA